MNPETLDAQSKNIDHLLRAGIAAAKSGERESARNLLMRVVEQDENNALAWLWLSGVVDSLDDRQVCLENVLALDPSNDVARKGLEWVRKQKAIQSPPPAVTTPAPAFSAAMPVRTYPTETTPMTVPPPEPLPAEPARVQEPVAPKLGLLLASTWDGFADANRCPYCATEILPDDRKCKTCGGNLMMKKRRREQRSVALWMLLTFQLFTVVSTAALPWAVLAVVAFLAGAKDPLALLFAYLGAPTSLPSQVVSTALATLSRTVFLLLFLPFLFSLGVFIGLYLRWRPIFWLFVLNSLLNVVVAFAGLALSKGGGLFAGAIGVGWALVGLYLLFRIEDDFYFEETRIVLQIDREANHATALMNRGLYYSRRKMWALSAIHFRKACGMMPNRTGCRLALAQVYVEMKLYELARAVLADIKRISPDNPAVAELARVLDKAQPGRA